MPKHIAILGAESSGKTELTKELAIYFQSDAVFEYAREYMDSQELSRSELEHIAFNQFQRENFVIQNSQSEYIFFDTEMINLKVWFDYAYGEVPDWLQSIDLKERYDYYLITANDLPWSEDVLRGMPDIEDRDKLLKRYIQELESDSVPYALISGHGESRLENAIHAIKEWQES